MSKIIEEDTYSNFEKGIHNRKFFSIIYNLCFISILIALLLPDIGTLPLFFGSSNVNIYFFWNQNLSAIEYIFGVALVVILIGFIFLVNRLSARLRSDILFKIFTFIFATSLFFTIYCIATSNFNEFINLNIFWVLLILTTITYYSFTVLLRKHNIRTFTIITVASAILMLIIIFFVPIFENKILIQKLLGWSRRPLWIIPALIFVYTILLTFIAPFMKTPYGYASINAHLFKIIIFLIPTSIFLSPYFQIWWYIVEILRDSLIVFGLYFLICYSLIEYFTTRIPVKIKPFAQPVHADQSDFVPTVFDTAEQIDPENSDPYKSPEE